MPSRGMTIGTTKAPVKRIERTLRRGGDRYSGRDRILIARHRPRSNFTPADADNVRQRFQTILRKALQKADAPPPKPLAARPKVATPAPPPPMARRKRA
jgi:hypothetical protein